MNPNPLFPPGPAGTQGFGSHTHNHTLSDQALVAELQGRISHCLDRARLLRGTGPRS